MYYYPSIITIFNSSKSTSYEQNSHIQRFFQEPPIIKSPSQFITSTNQIIKTVDISQIQNNIMTHRIQDQTFQIQSKPTHLFSLQQHQDIVYLQKMLTLTHFNNLCSKSCFQNYKSKITHLQRQCHQQCFNNLYRSFRHMQKLAKQSNTPQ